MNLWEWIFGPPTLRIDHQIFGQIFSSDRGRLWQVSAVQSIGCRGLPRLLIHGDQRGPFPECVETFKRIAIDWARIGPIIANEIQQLNHNYVDSTHGVPIEKPELVWDSTELLSIGVQAVGCFDLTYRFDWQTANDAHEITMVFKEWEFQGYHIDG